MQDYRQVLLHNYKERRRTNPRYSLRAYARDLQISPSRLSEIMSGKGNLSRDRAARIAEKLNLTPARRQYFFDLIDIATTTSQLIRSQALKRLEALEHDLAEVYFDKDQFEPIATWQNIAVWSFLFLPAYDGNCETIARSLKLSILDVYDTLHQLQIAKLVEHVEGRWKPTVNEFSSGDSVPSSVIRKYHESVSTLGRKSIEQQKFTERHLETLILPFKSDRIGEVGHKIGAFVQSLSKEFGETYEGDSVYALSLQFFRLGEKPDNRN